MEHLTLFIAACLLCVAEGGIELPSHVEAHSAVRDPLLAQQLAKFNGSGENSSDNVTTVVTWDTANGSSDIGQNLSGPAAYVGTLAAVKAKVNSAQETLNSVDDDTLGAARQRQALQLEAMETVYHAVQSGLTDLEALQKQVAESTHLSRCIKEQVTTNLQKMREDVERLQHNPGRLERSHLEKALAIRFSVLMQPTFWKTELYPAKK